MQSTRPEIPSVQIVAHLGRRVIFSLYAYRSVDEKIKQLERCNVPLISLFEKVHF